MIHQNTLTVELKMQKQIKFVAFIIFSPTIMFLSLLIINDLFINTLSGISPPSLKGSFTGRQSPPRGGAPGSNPLGDEGNMPDNQLIPNQSPNSEIKLDNPMFNVLPIIILLIVVTTGCLSLYFKIDKHKKKNTVQNSVGAN